MGKITILEKTIEDLTDELNNKRALLNSVETDRDNLKVEVETINGRLKRAENQIQRDEADGLMVSRIIYGNAESPAKINVLKDIFKHPNQHNNRLCF